MVIIKILVLLREGLHYLHVLLFREEIKIFDSVCGFDTRIDDNIPLIVNDAVKLLRRQAQQITDLVGQRPEIPYMGYGNDQGDVSHALASYLLFRHLNAAAVADDTLVTYPLVFSAMAFIILHRSEDPLAEEAVTFRLVGTVVYCLRLQDLAA